MAHRYFAARIEGDTAFLEGADANHLARVLRARPGDEVILCDGAGTDCDAVVESADPDTVQLRITARRPCAAEPPFAVTVFAGYPKQDKLETIIQKSVELGAACITPFFSRFCVAAPKNEDKKNVRYARIAAEAAKQCGRGILPEVSMPVTVPELCRLAPQFDRVLFFYEKGGQPLRQAALPAPPAGGRAALITGAEGGFSPEEADALIAAGAVPVGLGPRILRCETAPLAGLAACMCLWGQLE
ncbi:16S rRNA (uracil(1498)-N(3))-methyltransferase [Gemmiger formicilis]|uniref:RsmE family RNA methyltransferase n=1 Tax=Gemmiger formicilis TaxID=745368 RepID=UPI00195D7826|nr:RsmE family RNA methyltransferase [Gemmiger formicilis]MBM6914625.1 16S rRNA (uracil(1498)-N(3))-methyltransferase [Gemmiger formicilis]